jgi:hypothetical protein
MKGSLGVIVNGSATFRCYKRSRNNRPPILHQYSPERLHKALKFLRGLRDMVSSRHQHHHVSPFTVAVILLLIVMAGGMRAGYFKGAFHQDILARINPADVLTPADMVPAHVAAGQVAAPTAQSSASAAR